MFGPLCGILQADGGTLRLVEQQGKYRVSIFTSPNPLRAGPVDISLFVQEADTAQPVPEAQATVIVTPSDGVGPSSQSPATTEAATNKLLRAALFDLPTANKWDVEIQCEVDRERIVGRFTMETVEPLPAWLSVWPWFCWPLVAIFLFGLHRLFVARKPAGRDRTPHRVS
ncbi:MAG: hypothetical protein K8U03_20590 [Planctomycetia bacterium]|nr:hypothetical protein [Planctomycetia bacterium]